MEGRRPGARLPDELAEGGIVRLTKPSYRAPQPRFQRMSRVKRWRWGEAFRARYAFALWLDRGLWGHAPYRG